LKRYKSPGTDQIIGELIQTGSEILRFDINELNNSVWNKEQLLGQQKESITVPICKTGDK
jgi:hypothetical protein